ncbi:hypothetical protein [Microbulbifer magnicolonia]|uniref:hypothetical protein n=1 Tax=Microbulbifer magnicolonia TaxID=3109744 RepID=UPI002B417184|nr:hypothetical protein [Microbulbifer sp. GG15]
MTQKKDCFLKHEIIVEDNPNATLKRISHNLSRGGYWSSFTHVPAPFGTEDDNWCPPPELEWYENIVMGYCWELPDQANSILINIARLHRHETELWDSYQKELRESVQ